MNNKPNNGYDPQKFQRRIPDEGNFSASPNPIDNQNNLNNNNNQSSEGNFYKKNQNGSSNSGNGPIKNYKKKLAKETFKKIGDAYAPGVGGQVVEELSKTEVGDKIINQAADNSTIAPGNPFNLLKARKNLKNQQDSKPNDEKNSVNGSIELSKQITKFLTLVPGLLSGCFVFLIIIAVISIIISPLFYMDSLLGKTSSFFEKVGNFVTLRGWCTDEECYEIEKNDFYDEVDKVHDKYKKEKNVELNTSLIIATLTYSDPLITLEDIEEDIENVEELPSSNMINFKKSKKMVSKLAQNMVFQETKCYDENDNEVDCDDEEIEDKTEKKYWKIDLNKYKKYLETYFIRYFYFDNKQGEEINIEIKNVIDEIFARVEFYEYISGTENSSDYFAINNTTVTILDCNNGLVMEEVSLYDYIQGVLYVEGFATGRSEEFLKLMAVVIKNYLYAINNADVNALPTNLRIKSCAMNQVYCSVTEGCHSMEDGADDNHDTIVSGPDANGNYYQKPLDDVETLKKIKIAIDSTFSEFVIENESFVVTQYRSSCVNETCNSSTNIMDQAVANTMIENGSSYQQVLNYFYKGNIEEINVSSVGYPLDLNNNHVTSAFGWRVHPIDNCCRTHGGTDIAASADDNIYSIADGVVVQNVPNHYSYGNYVVIGHGNYDATTNKYEYYSLYAHQIRPSTLVSVGEHVKAGQKIGNVGSTGESTGNHLHIEIYHYENNNKVKEDPVSYFKNVQLSGMVGGALYASEQQCIEESGCPSCN